MTTDLWYCKECEMFIEDGYLQPLKTHECVSCTCVFKRHHIKHVFYNDETERHRVIKLTLESALNRILHRSMLKKDKSEGEGLIG